MVEEKVLIVDDEEGLLHLMSLTLRRCGYVAETAASGLAALDILRSRGPFAVVVTDLLMPEMSGLELLRAARRLDPQLQGIIITAAGSLETAITALRVDGVYDYLLKPLDSMSQLSHAVEKAIEHRRLRIEQEALIRQSQAETERLRALVANTGDAILSANAQDLITIANPSAIRLLRQPNLLGSTASHSLPPPLAKLLVSWRAINPQNPVVIEIPWIDDSVQLVHITPVTTPGGDWQGWIMVLRDITHLKRLDELKTRMLVDAANKIRIPLAEAMNTVVKLNMLVSQDERVTEAIYKLNQVWRRIKEWTDDLLELVRLDTEGARSIQAVELGSLVRELARSQERNLVQGKGLRISPNLTPGLPLVQADPDLLLQILNGLVARAALRSERGDEIRLNARRHGGQVVIEVIDNGPPINQSDLPHLFERSFVSLKTGSLNSGIELAMAKALADRMGGQVWIGGQNLRGSVVTVCLPEAPPQEN